MSAHQAASNSKFVPGAPKKSSHDGQWQLAWLRALRLCSCRLPNTYPNDCCEVRFRSVELYDFGNTALESLFVADLFARRHVVRPLCCRNAILFSDVRLRRVCQPPRLLLCSFFPFRQWPPDSTNFPNVTILGMCAGFLFTRNANTGRCCPQCGRGGGSLRLCSRSFF